VNIAKNILLSQKAIKSNRLDIINIFDIDYIGFSTFKLLIKIATYGTLKWKRGVSFAFKKKTRFI
jgi:hypothetical protein